MGSSGVGVAHQQAEITAIVNHCINELATNSEEVDVHEFPFSCVGACIILSFPKGEAFDLPKLISFVLWSGCCICRCPDVSLFNFMLAHCRHTKPELFAESF